MNHKTRFIYPGPHLTDQETKAQKKLNNLFKATDLVNGRTRSQTHELEKGISQTLLSLCVAHVAPIVTSSLGNAV